MDLFSKLREGLGYSLFQVLLRHLIQFVSTLVLARVLVPYDFGLVAMAATWMTFLSFFSEMGLSWVTLQNHQLTREQIDNLFWVNTGIGLLLALACLPAGSLLAGFYNEAALRPLVWVQGLIFLAGGLGVQPAALLRRDLRFRAFSLIEIGGITLGQAGAVILALAGWGAWALVLGGLIGGLVRLVLLFAVTGYRPGFYLRSRGTRAHVGIGGTITLASLGFYFVRNLDGILIGRSFGTEELAFYSRAYFLVNTPALMLATTFAGIVIPSISSASSPAEAGDAYRRSLKLLVWIIAPFSAGLAAASEDCVRFVYGPQWAACGPLVRWLALAGVIQPLFLSVGWLLLGHSRNRFYLVWSLIAAAVMAAAFAAGLPHGASGVAIGFLIGMAAVLALPSLYSAHRAVGLDWRQTLQALLPALGCAALVAGAVAAAGSASRTLELSWPLTMALEIAAGLLVFLPALAHFELRPAPRRA